jgi:hypothetical protein
MSDFLEKIASEIGASDTDKFISFLSRRGQGTPREIIAQQLRLSPRTLYNWNTELQEISKERRYKAVIKAIIEDEDLNFQVVE